MKRADDDAGTNGLTKRTPIVARCAAVFGTRFGRIALAVLLLAAVGWWAYDAYLRPRRPSGPSVRVATWNLRQFSANRDDLDYAGMAQRITQWRFDVLALQEVKGDGAAVAKLVAALNAGSLLGGSWTSELGPEVGNGERFAFVYNAAIPSGSSASNRCRRRNCCGSTARRWPADSAAANFDFTLVDVHLFASDAARRRGESAQLALSLLAKTLPAGERDVIVAGDFNTTTRRGGDGALGPFLAAGWEAINDAPTNLKGDAIYDNLLIDPAATREWTGRAGVEPLGVPADVARRTLSDHLPLWADFAVSGPDDD